MATYKEIKGVTVQTLDEDPVLPGGSWGSGGSLPQNQRQFAGFGTQTAAIVAGGNTPNPKTGNSYTYDGASWSEVAELNTARFALGFSTNAPQSSGIVFGGQHPQVANAEVWNGSSWTEVNDLNTTRSKLGSAGASSTSALAFGGTQDPGDQATTELWNGSTWTEVNDLNTARYNPYRTGIATAALAAGGANPNNVANVESWNGSSWTETTDIPVAASSGGAAGLYTNSIIFGGASATANLATTLSWDGSAWTELSAMSTARQEMAQAGGSSGADTALAVAGYTSTEVSTVEEWSTPPATQAKLREGMIFLSAGQSLKGFGRAGGVPSATWASGGSLNAARYRMSGAGGGATVSASMLCGGYKPSSAPPNDYFDNTEIYNGTSFTEVNNLNEAGSSAAGFGSSTSAIMAGGGGGTRSSTEVESWDGTNWTEVSELNAGRSQFNGAGLSETAGIVMGGHPGKSSATESWNGSAWTEVNNLNTARDEFGSAGSQTSAAIFGGNPPGNGTDAHEQWDGTSWTEAAEINTAVIAPSGSGAANSLMLKIGGAVASNVNQTKTEVWNGSSWTEIADLSLSRSYVHAAPGTAASCILAGGATTPPSGSPATYGLDTNEEFEADNALSTVTVS